LRRHRHVQPDAPGNAGETNGSATSFGITTRHGCNGCSGLGANGQCARHSSGHRSNQADGRHDGITGGFGSG
jgi:hypothetical protein